MPKINELDKSEVNIGARVNKHLVDLLKEADIPVSEVIKSSIVHFLTLSDQEKVLFIHNNNINSDKQVMYPTKLWCVLKQLYGKDV